MSSDDDDDDDDRIKKDRIRTTGRNNHSTNSNNDQRNIIILSDKIEEATNKHILHAHLNNYNSNRIDNRSCNDDAEKILSNEFNRLSINKRTEVQEEVHGVHCLAVDETPALLITSLQQLAMELNDDTKIPPSQKGAYLLSQERQQQFPSKQYFVGSDEFRLMYIRRELFDVKKAALCFVEALEFLLDVYGEISFERKITLQDFTPTEINIMKKGYVQVLPNRDRSGRRIIMLYVAEISNNVDLVIRHKIGFYLSLCCANDIEDQRKGNVYIWWFDNKNIFQLHPSTYFRGKNSRKISDFTPVRSASLHFCASESPFFQLVKTIFIAKADSNTRVRLNFNFGEYLEVQYLLLGFGIPVDCLPITGSGKIKTENMKRFIRGRSYIESTLYEDEENKRLSVVDVPYLTDILIKKGLVALHQYGNIRFRCIVQSIYIRHHSRAQQQQETNSNNNYSPKVPPYNVSLTSLIPEIINEIRRENLRVLFWNQTESWWNLLYDEKEFNSSIYQRVNYLVKGARFISLVSKLNNQTPRQQQVSHSDTSIFQAQDGKKRKRLNDSTNDNNNSNKDICSINACFGMSFFPTGTEKINYEHFQ